MATLASAGAVALGWAAPAPARPSRAISAIPTVDLAARVSLDAGTSGTSASSASCPTLSSVLCYWGGSVLRTHSVYLIFWAPPGFTFPGARDGNLGYQDLVDRYMSDVVHDSGSSDNVYAAVAQYGDQSGGGRYSVSAYHAIEDASPYPSQTRPATVGCSYSYESTTFGSSSASPCLTDDDLRGEIARLVAADGWPSDGSAVYFVLTPPNVGGCVGSGAAGYENHCAYTHYCAYHGDAARVYYASIPYPDPGGSSTFSSGPCAGQSNGQPAQFPNGGAGDVAVNLISHEHIESITDPAGDAWYASSGDEIADLCEYSFGAALGQTALAPGDYYAGASDYNQVIGGHDYWLQTEWSDAAGASGGCVQRNVPVTAQVPSTATAGAAVTVSATGGTSAYPIAKLVWDFGDGTSSQTTTASSVDHTFSQPGSYTVTVTAYDAYGDADATSSAVAVTGQASPAAASTPSPQTTVTSPAPPAPTLARRLCRRRRRTLRRRRWICRPPISRRP